MLFYFDLVIAMCFIILTLSGFLVSHVIVLWGERRSHEVNLWICFSSSVHHLQQTRLCCIFVFRKGVGGGGGGGEWRWSPTLPRGREERAILWTVFWAWAGSGNNWHDLSGSKTIAVIWTCIVIWSEGMVMRMTANFYSTPNVHRKSMLVTHTLVV